MQSIRDELDQKQSIKRETGNRSVGATTLQTLHKSDKFQKL